MTSALHNKRILVFGGTGSLGRALIRRLSNTNHLCVFSRDEAKHWTIKNQLLSNQRVEFHVGDIRDLWRVETVIRQFNPEVIVIAAALKHVDTCEQSPQESIATNILGVNNVVQSVLRIERELSEPATVLMVSTDKACAPTNVYGMSKAISERIVTSSATVTSLTRFIGVRYGNVLESRGSIVPLFRFQAQQRKPLTVTHEDMTRFIMTLDQSIDLIESAVLYANSGQIWLPKLNSMRIIELAEIFSHRYSLDKVITGMRPGEKIHEELISEAESTRVIDDDTKYFKLNSSLSSEGSRSLFNFSSADRLVSLQELEHLLDSLGVFDLPLNYFIGREIEEISER